MSSSQVAETIEHFFSQYRVRQYKKGQVLILNGDDTGHVYNIVSGRVKMYDITYRGDELILNVFKPPAFFPMSLVINKTPNPYTYEAETEVEVRRAPASDIMLFLKDNPEVVLDLLSRVYHGMDGILGRMTHLMSSSAKVRLMFEILTAMRRFGTLLENGQSVLTMNESELAARAGLSRETVSREMRKLEKGGYVRLQAGTLIVDDMNAFEDKLSNVM